MGMLKSGAVGYIVKNESPENLCAAIAAVARGETWFSQCIAKKLAAWAQAAPVSAVELTAQEMNVLRLLARGKNDAEIMATLQIAPRTLRHHLQNVMKKIGAQERAQAMWWALENGFGEKQLRQAQAPYGSSQK